MCSSVYLWLRGDPALPPSLGLAQSFITLMGMRAWALRAWDRFFVSRVADLSTLALVSAVHCALTQSYIPYPCVSVSVFRVRMRSCNLYTITNGTASSPLVRHRGRRSSRCRARPSGNSRLEIHATRVLLQQAIPVMLVPCLRTLEQPACRASYTAEHRPDRAAHDCANRTTYGSNRRARASSY